MQLSYEILSAILTILLATLLKIHDGIGSVLAVDNYSQEFVQIYHELYNPNSPTQLTYEQVRQRLERANELRSLYSIDCDHFNERASQLRTLLRISRQHSCSFQALNNRIDLELHYQNHVNLGPYSQYFNRLEFARCAKRLDTRLYRASRFIPSDHLKPISELVRNPQQLPRANINWDTDIDERQIARALMEYLQSEFHYDLKKPDDISMYEQIGIVISYINDILIHDCAFISERYGRDYIIFQLFHVYDLNLRLFLRPSVIQFMDYLKICNTISFQGVHMYPLGYFEFNDLLDNIFSPNDDTSMEPLKIQGLLDIALYVGQAELAIGMDNIIVMKRLLDLLTVSQVDVEKCHPDYIKLIVNAKSTYESYPNLARYLDHYGRLQLQQCMLEFEPLLNEQITLSMNDQDLQNLGEMHRIWTNIARQLNSNIKLHKDIPYNVLRLAVPRFFAVYGHDLFDPAHDGQLDSIRPAVKKLFKSCRKLVRKLQIFADYFENFDLLDLPNASVISEETFNWIANYKICLDLINLPPRIEFVN